MRQLRDEGDRDVQAAQAVCALLVVVGLLVVPSVASAAITSVFGTVTCTEQTGANAGPALVRQLRRHDRRRASTARRSTSRSHSRSPPGEDNNYPVVGIYHGWGGTKITPSSATAQRWLKLGYAVFSITDRGWGSSCGGPSKPANTVKAAPCEHGYIHLMSRALRGPRRADPARQTRRRRRHQPAGDRRRRAAATAAACRCSSAR